MGAGDRGGGGAGTGAEVDGSNIFFPACNLRTDDANCI